MNVSEIKEYQYFAGGTCADGPRARPWLGADRT
jgi:hypothetical protein